MTQAGGASDKYGNEYESWWTITRLMDVLSGRAHTITLEPIGPGGAGVEFAVREPDRTVREQVKSGTSRPNLSLNTVARDLVRPVLDHLHRGDSIRFVLASPAREFTGLLDGVKAGRPDPDGLEAFASLLGAERGEVQDLLERIEVEHWPGSALRNHVEARVGEQVSGSPSSIVRRLHGWLFQKVHQTIDANDVRSFLGEDGLHPRDLRDDPAVAVVLRQSVDRYVRRLRSAAGPIAIVGRHELETLVQQLEGGARIVMLHGDPGIGKSQVIGKLLERFDSVPAVVIRMDALQSVAYTASQLGEQFGLNGSPGQLLGAFSADQPSLLVVDQLDAVSSFSGRITEAFAAVEDLLDRSRSWPQMRVLLSVRTVDLRRDPRFAAILKREDCVEVELGGLNPDQIAEALEAAEGTAISEKIRRSELVKNPLYLRLAVDAGASFGRDAQLTPTDLFDAVEVEAQRSAPDGTDVGQWNTVMQALARTMVDSESLTVPASIAVPFRLTVDSLVSAGLLIEDGSGISFFHERFMDHVFARSFVDAGESLREFLLGSGQALFRRGQTRQVLQRLIDLQPRRFFDVALDLLEDGAIRTHIKQVVIEVARGLSPTPSEWRRCASVAKKLEFAGNEIRELLGLPAWFDACHAADGLQELMEEPFAAQVVPVMLRNLGERPDALRDVLLPRLDAGRFSDEVRYSLLQTRHQRPSALVEELVARGCIDETVEGLAVVPDGVWTLTYTFKPGDPVATWWVALMLRRALQLCDEQGLADPFEHGVLSRHYSHAPLSEIADAAPEEFLEAVLPFVLDLARRTVHLSEGDEHARSRWDRYFHSSLDDLDEAIFDAVATAVASASRDPRAGAEAIRHLSSEEQPTRAAAYLTARALEAIGDADLAFSWLVDEPKNLRLKWDGLRYGTSASLIRQFASSASPTSISRLLSLVHSEVPPFEKSTYGWKRRGWAEWSLLLAFPEAVLPVESLRRREELIRKFGSEAPKPTTITSGMVRSPIGHQAASRMSDEQWLRAMESYHGNREHWDGDFLKGSALELSRLLEQLAEEDPERFLQLGLSLTPQHNSTYIEHLIRGLAGKVRVNDLLTLASRARMSHGTSVGRTVAWAFEKHAGPWPPEAVELICAIACDEDPSPGSEGFADERKLADQLTMLGLNSNRGAAAHALAKHVWAKPELDITTIRTIRQLVEDDVPAIRDAACEVVGALSHLDESTAVELAEALFARGLEPLATVEGFTLFRYAAFRSPWVRVELLSHALEHGDVEVATNAGAVWAAMAHFELLDPRLPGEFRNLTASARIGVAGARMHSNQNLEVICEILSDSETSVREEAVQRLRHLTEIPTKELSELLRWCLASENFTEVAEGLVDLLLDYDDLYPREAILVLERALSASTLATAVQQRRGSTGSIPDILKILLRLQRQDPVLFGDAVLDCMDAMIETQSRYLWHLLDEDDAD